MKNTVKLYSDTIVHINYLRRKKESVMLPESLSNTYIHNLHMGNM